MQGNNYVTELLHTGLGTEGQLLIERTIHASIIDEASKHLIPRSEAAIVVGPESISGSSYDLDLLSPDSMDVRETAEGGEIFIDQPVYTNTNIKPTKYGVGIRITRELLEDGKWNLLQHAVMIAGRRFAENENSLIIGALDGATATVGGGAQITLNNITTAMLGIENNDYTPTSFVVGFEVLSDLRNIDTFVEADKLGDTRVLESGFIGRIFGMNVFRVSTNAGATTTSAYVYDRAHAFVVVEKRTITVENFELPAFDMSAASVTQRLAVATLRADSIEKITTS